MREKSQNFCLSLCEFMSNNSDFIWKSNKKNGISIFGSTNTYFFLDMCRYSMCAGYVKNVIMGLESYLQTIYQVLLPIILSGSVKVIGSESHSAIWPCRRWMRTRPTAIVSVCDQTVMEKLWPFRMLCCLMKESFSVRSVDCQQAVKRARLSWRFLVSLFCQLYILAKQLYVVASFP